MDERGTPSYVPQEGQQVPPTQYAPAEPQPQQTPVAEQPQYTYTPYAAAPQQPQYAAPQQPQYAAPQQPQYAAPQQPQQAAPKAKRGGAHGGPGGPKLPNLPKWLLPAVGGAVALILVIVLAVTAFGGGTEDKIADAAVGTIERLSESEPVSLVKNTLNGGSMTIMFDGTDVLSEISGEDIEATGEVKFYLDLEGGKTALEVTAELMGTAIDAGIYVNEESFALTSDVLLDGDAYGIDLTKLAENLEDSVFGPDGPMYIGDIYGEEFYEMYISILEGELIDEKTAEKLVKDAEKLAEEYIDFTVSTIFKHAEIEKENDTVKIGGEKVKAQIITITVDGEAMVNIVIDLLEKVESDKKLNKFLYQYAELMNDTMEAMDMDDVDYVDMLDDMYDSLEDALDDMEDVLEDAEDLDIKITAEVWLKGGNLLGGKLKGMGTTFELKIGPDPTKPEYISFKMDDGYYPISAVYEVETNDKDKFEATFVMDEDGYELVNLAIEYDKKDGDWELTTTDSWGDTYGIAGNLEIKKDVYTITFTELIGEGAPEEANMLLEAVTVVIDTDDKTPDVPKFVDILTLDEDELQEVIEEIGETVSAIMEEIGGNMNIGGGAVADIPAVAG